MRPVISVSLNGRIYPLEDDAHAALARYLDAAAHALADNPDRAEILADLEQAIADKGERYLNPHKTVLSLSEIEQIVRELGPVESGSDTSAGHGAASAGTGGPPDGAAAPPAGGTGATDKPKRLYLIGDGAVLGGVCKGIAVYLNADVTLVRVGFVLAALLTGGLAVLVYVAMMFFVPYASTAEEHAEAHGLPFNARILVEQAKLRAAHLAQLATHAARAGGSREERAQWRAEWRRAHAQWRAEWRRSRAQWHAEWRARRWGVPPQAAAGAPHPAPPLVHAVSTLLWAVLSIVVALVTIGWLFALFSLLTTGALLGWVPHAVPLWVAVIGLIVLYKLLVSPLRALRRATSPYAYGLPHRCAHHHPWAAFWELLVNLTLIGLVVWFVAHHVPALQQWLDQLQQHTRPAWEQTAAAWQRLRSAL